MSHKSLLRESGSGHRVRILREFCEVPEISGVNLLSTGDQDQRLPHSKINESLIDDLDADGRKDRPTQYTKLYRHMHKVKYTLLYTYKAHKYEYADHSIGYQPCLRKE